MIRKIFSHPVWFLIGALIFVSGGVRFVIKGDMTGAIIYFVAGFLSLVGFIGRTLFDNNHKKKDNAREI